MSETITRPKPVEKDKAADYCHLTTIQTRGDEVVWELGRALCGARVPRCGPSEWNGVGRCPKCGRPICPTCVRMGSQRTA